MHISEIDKTFAERMYDIKYNPVVQFNYIQFIDYMYYALAARID